ncbi:MAG: hypothetical protein KDJ69_04585 [Nitratireductor sp.]|nr:hypothetical protein [Nitratireductor sp.]
MVAFSDIITKGSGVRVEIWDGANAVADPGVLAPVTAFSETGENGLPEHPKQPTSTTINPTSTIVLEGSEPGPFQARVHFWLWNPHRVRMRNGAGDPETDFGGLLADGQEIDLVAMTQLPLPVGLHEMIVYVSRPTEEAVTMIFEVTYDDGGTWHALPPDFLYPEAPELDIRYRTIRMTVPDDQMGLSYASDLYVDPVSNELVMIDNAHAVAQHVGQRIHTFWGEWYLDQEIGIQWLQEVMGKRDTRAQLVAEALLRTEIMATPGVRDIVEMELVTDLKTRGILTRSLVVSTELNTDTDVVTAF